MACCKYFIYLYILYIYIFYIVFFINVFRLGCKCSVVNYFEVAFFYSRNISYGKHLEKASYATYVLGPRFSLFKAS